MGSGSVGSVTERPLDLTKTSPDPTDPNATAAQHVEEEAEAEAGGPTSEEACAEEAAGRGGWVSRRRRVCGAREPRREVGSLVSPPRVWGPPG